MVMSNPRGELPEDAKHVPVHEGHEHGYHGVLPDTEDNAIYTLAGVTKDESKGAEAAESAKPAPGAGRGTAKKEADK